MASLSNFSPTGGQQNPGDRQNLTLSDCTCPICMYILIEPVIMPCKHELCMMCFQKNVQEASLTCPLCRKRISTWARRATKLNKLIDEKRWTAIKEAFPQKVKNRMEGLEEEEDSEEEEEFIHVPNIAAPGEIRVEYEQEVQKVEAEREQVRLEEEAASRALIHQLQEEEEARRREQEQLMQQDEELVRRLMADGSSSVQSSPSVRSTPKSTMLDRFITRGHSSKSCTSVSPLGPPPRPSALSSASDTTASDTSIVHLSRSSIGSPAMVQTPCRDSMGRRSSSVVLIEDSNTSLLSADLNISPGASSSRSASANASEISFSGGDNNKTQNSETQTQRPGSADSMSQELCHFKPIHCSPCTPPRHRVGGKFVNPPVIRSTPRNLSQIQNTEDEAESGASIPDGSPVMRRRLSQLAEERKEKVAAMSKSTGPDLPLLPTMNNDSQSCSPFLLRTTQHDKSTSGAAVRASPDRAVRTLSFDTGSTSGGFGTAGTSTTRMILPLEPNLEDSDESSEPDPPRPFRFFTENLSQALKGHTDCSSPDNGVNVWLRAKRKKERDWSDSSDRASGSSNSNCSREAKVTTTLLTPDTLAERKEKVRKGSYIDETPQMLRLENNKMTSLNSPHRENSSRASSNDSSRSSSLVDAKVTTSSSVQSASTGEHERREVTEISQKKMKNRTESCASSHSSCSLEAKVTTTLLTPTTLAERKRKVLSGSYVEETPQLLKKGHEKVEQRKGDCRASSASTSQSKSSIGETETLQAGEEKNNRETSRNVSSCSLEEKITTMPKRQTSLPNEKQSVHEEKNKGQTKSSESQTEEKRSSVTSPTNRIMGSVKKCWEIITSPLRSHSASGDPGAAESSTKGGSETCKEASLTEVDTATNRDLSSGDAVSLPKEDVCIRKSAVDICAKEEASPEETKDSSRQLRGNRQRVSSESDRANTECLDRNKTDVPTTHMSPVKNSSPQKLKSTPNKKRSPQKQATPTRRSERNRNAVNKDINNIEDSPQKVRQNNSSQCSKTEASPKDAEPHECPNKPGMKRVRSTEDKENEETPMDCMPDNPPKRTCTNSHDVDDTSDEEVFQSPKKSSRQKHFAIEYSPEADGKRLKKFPKSRLTTKGKATKQAKLCFVTSPDAGTSGVQNKLVFTSNSGSRKGKKSTASTSSKKSPAKRRKQRPTEPDSSDKDNHSEAEEEPQVPGPKFLDRSHFSSNREYKRHLEEQDRLLALQLQADFDLERKLRLTAIRRKGSDGQYELRQKGRSQSSVSKSRKTRGK